MPNAAPRFTLPASFEGWPLVLLIAVYLLVGATGHLPWRGDALPHLGPIPAVLTPRSGPLPGRAGGALPDRPPAL